MTASERIFAGFAWLAMFGQDAARLLQERPRYRNVSPARQFRIQENSIRAFLDCAQSPQSRIQSAGSLEPGKGQQAACSDLLYEIDDASHFQPQTFITVD